MQANDAWMNEPRDEKGRWTTGGELAAQATRHRMASVVNGVVGHLQRPDRGRFSAWLDRGGAITSANILKTYADAATMHPETFARTFGADRVDTATLLRLRDVAATVHHTNDDVAATNHLADTVKSLGVDRFITLAANLNQPAWAASEAAPNSPPPYVAQNPQAWLGRASVGDGNCVPLVKAATGAPPSSKWHAGEPVRGNTTLPPGTAIAVFDADGSYGNHTDHSSHAAIYMGQDAEGIYVIEQYLLPVKDSGRQTPVPPRKNYYEFDRANGVPIQKWKFISCGALMSCALLLYWAPLAERRQPIFNAKKNSTAKSYE